jgi:hypothetical protein
MIEQVKRTEKGISPFANIMTNIKWGAKPGINDTKDAMRMTHRI